MFTPLRAFRLCLWSLSLCLLSSAPAMLAGCGESAVPLVGNHSGPGDGGSPASGGDSPVGGGVGKVTWTGAWSGAPYGPYPLGPLSGSGPADLPSPLSPLPTIFVNDQAVDQSFRMIVHPTVAGVSIRVRLSNLVGNRPVVFEPIRIAQSLSATGPAIVPTTDTPVLFAGKPGVTVAPGQEAVSDAVAFSYAVGADLAISFRVVGESGPITWHAISFGPNYISLPMLPDVTADPSGAAFSQTSLGWFFLSGLDAQSPESLGTLVAIGDSITDGAYTVNNTRWTDYLAQRLQDAGIVLGVLNQGINGNTVNRRTQASAGQGDAAVDRFTRDVLDRPGVRSVLIFEGTNDLGGGASAAKVFDGIRTMVERAHQSGLCVVVGTITPRSNTPAAAWDLTEREPQRKLLNELIRAQRDVEGIADFDAVMVSPASTDQPNPLYFWPDLLHPNALGMSMMANAVPIQALVRPPVGTCAR